MQRRSLLAATLAAPAVARAQPAWPNDRPVEVIVPFPPGGGVDVMTRLVMPLVAERVPGMRVVVSNRPGAASPGAVLPARPGKPGASHTGARAGGGRGRQIFENIHKSLGTLLEVACQHVLTHHNCRKYSSSS